MALIFSDDSDSPQDTSKRPTASQMKPFRPQDTLVENVGPFESAVRGFASGSTGGLVPKVGAAISSLWDSRSYPQILHDYLERDKAAQINHPVISTVSNVAGSVPLTAATGGGGAARQVATNAALGAANAYGNTEKEGMAAAREAGQGGLVSGSIAAMFPILGKIFGGATEAIKGSNSPKKIADAAMEYKDKVLVPPSTVKGMPNAGKEALTELNMPIKTAPVPGRPSAPVTDAQLRKLIEEDPYMLGDTTLKQVIGTHNAKAPSLGKTLSDVVVPSLGTGAAAAGGTYYMTDGDIDKSVKAGVGGTLAGIAGSGWRAARQPTAKLRMPERPEPGQIAGPMKPVTDIPTGLPPNLDYIGDAVQNATHTNIVQGGARNAQAVTKEPTSPFGVLTDWLDHSKGADNPAVEEKAKEAEQISANGTPEDKRKAAMELQNTPDGRAVTNQESKRRFIDDEEN